MLESETFADQTGPGQLFEHYIAMEELIDKLKWLNYENDTNRVDKKALSRHYFAIQTNPGEQFYLCVSLAAWLIRKCGVTIDQPQEYDDPNSTISTLLEYARQFGATVDFPPNRLKQGHGEHVVYVLNCLADQALKVASFSKNLKKAEPQDDNSQIAEEVVDDSELLIEKVEEEMLEMSGSDHDTEDDDDEALNLDDLRNIQIHRNLLQQQRPEQVLQSSVRLDEWQTEVERVLPQLRVTVESDAGDWRSHLEQMQRHRNNVVESFKSSKQMLNKTQADIKTTLEKIDNREKHVNGQLEGLMMDYRDRMDELKVITEQYNTVNSGVTDRIKILSALSEQLEAVKKDTEERSSSMTDGSPLINAKKAIARLRMELKELDVRIGVFDNEILQARLRHKAMDHMDLSEPAVAY